MTRGLSPFRRNEKRTPGVNSAPMGVNSGEMGTVPFRRRGRSQPAGAVLLEVLISLALLVFGMSVVGLQINMGLEAARHADLGTKAVMLADSKMAELSAGVVLPEINDEEMTGDFGTLYPGFSWRLRFRPTDEPTFLMVTLDIGYNESVIPTQLASPESELEFEDLGNKIVQTVYRLMPIPADVDLTRDFGLDQDKIAKRMELAGLGAGGAAGELSQEGAGTQPAGGGGDLPGGLPQIPGMGDLSQIMELLGPLLEGGSFDPRMLTQLPPEQYQQVAQLLEMVLGRGGIGSPQMQQQLQELLSRAGGGRGGQRGGPPGGPPGPPPGGPNAGAPNQPGGPGNPPGGSTGGRRDGRTRGDDRSDNRDGGRSGDRPRSSPQRQNDPKRNPQENDQR